MTKVIIFDFDGTLADTLEVILMITNRLSEEFGYKPATKEELAHIQQLNSWEIVIRSGIPVFKLPLLLRRVRAELNNHIQDIHLFSGIKGALIDLKKQGYRLGIITSNSRENVLDLMGRNDLQDIFDFIISGVSVFGKHKTIKAWLKTQRVNRHDIIYVGDETRDIEAAKKAQIKVIAVTWGFNAKEALVEYQPDFIIERPDRLLEAIAHWSSA